MEIGRTKQKWIYWKNFPQFQNLSRIVLRKKKYLQAFCMCYYQAMHSFNICAFLFWRSMLCFHRKSQAHINKQWKETVSVNRFIQGKQNSVRVTVTQVFTLPFAMHRKGQTDVHTKKYMTRIAHELQWLKPQLAELKLSVAHSPDSGPIHLPQPTTDK